ncbi:MAG TPA: AraC family transcriptional regulator [Mycobacteriales bacterium]|nr:AraC family transcriptional regulator [Mycobacteriales bacterium]
MENPTVTADGFPLVAQASEVQLGADRGPSFTRVESRMALGCHSGRGTVTINGRRYPLGPSSLFLLPWGHAISYAADPAVPLFVYGMHLIPWHRADAPVELAVPHDPRHHLAGVPWRRDVPLGADTEVVVGTEQQRPALAALVRYAIHLGQHTLPGVDVARALGTLALAEFPKPRRPPLDDVPVELHRLLTWIDAHLTDPITLAGLAALAHRGTTTVNRLFHRHLGLSPMTWVAGRRIDLARRLLSTTHLTVGQVATACGIADPYYFSRLFKEHTGMAPRDWRRHRATP